MLDVFFSFESSIYVFEMYFNFSSKQNNSSLSNDRSRLSKLPNLPPQALKHLWIRTALMEKLLDKIVLYLVENSKYVIYYICQFQVLKQSYKIQKPTLPLKLIFVKLDSFTAQRNNQRCFDVSGV